MQLSSKTQNACLAVFELALRYEDPQPVSLRTISDAHGVSSQFLVQVLLQLKRAGLVQSIRGAGGGYRLAMAPGKISLGDVFAAMDGPQNGATLFKQDNVVARVLSAQWKELTDSEEELLSRATFDKMVAAAQSQASGMYYI